MGRFGRLILLASVCFGMLGLRPLAASASPQPSCGDTLTHDTTLTADLDCSSYNSTALVLGANGITLNLGGHKLIGPDDGSTYGVDTGSSSRNDTITNGTITGFYIDVYLDYSSDTTISNLKMTDAGNHNDYAVYEDYGAGNTIVNNTITGFYDATYSEYGAGNKYVDNVISGITSYGIYFDYDAGDLIKGNKITGDGSSTDGVYDDESENQHYIGNRFDQNDYGLYTDCGDEGRTFVKHNIADNNSSYGFYIYDCYGEPSYAPGTGSKVVGNIARGNDTGFYDYYSIDGVYRDNLAKHNVSYGFEFDYPSEMIIRHNVANNNGGSSYGFDITENYADSDYNAVDFSYNTANSNYYGIYADYGIPGSHNHAHHNTEGDNYADCYNVSCG
jgi:nitrous oxidase accessory protein NosD